MHMDFNYWVLVLPRKHKRLFSGWMLRWRGNTWLAQEGKAAVSSRTGSPADAVLSPSSPPPPELSLPQGLWISAILSATFSAAGTKGILGRLGTDILDFTHLWALLWIGFFFFLTQSCGLLLICAQNLCLSLTYRSHRAWGKRVVSQNFFFCYPEPIPLSFRVKPACKGEAGLQSRSPGPGHNRCAPSCPTVCQGWVPEPRYPIHCTLGATVIYLFKSGLGVLYTAVY